MDFTNINDPAGVKALLDQLRTSQAWQELSNGVPPTAEAEHSSHSAEVARSPSVPPPHEPEPEPEISPFVSDLLSRLQSDGRSEPSRGLNHTAQHVDASQNIRPRSTLTSSSSTPTPSVDVPIPTTSFLSSSQAKDPRFLNFNQALPVIARLSEDPTFMERLGKMQDQQAHLERKLWEERTQTSKAQQEKVKVAQAKAAIVGGGLSQHDASALRNSFQKELRMFDCKRVLPAWDALMAEQQATLEALGVPGMFMTTLKVDREKQQRIVQVLDGLSGSGDDDMEL